MVARLLVKMCQVTRLHLSKFNKAFKGLVTRLLPNFNPKRSQDKIDHVGATIMVYFKSGNIKLSYPCPLLGNNSLKLNNNSSLLTESWLT